MSRTNKDQQEIPFDLKTRLLNHVILRSGIEASQGLFYGKMGCVLLLAHAARDTGIEVYSEIANDILDEIWSNINQFTSVQLTNGSCGIGWGIEYLIQNDFMEGDANELCADIDTLITSGYLKTMIDTSLETGLSGIIHYVMIRVRGCIEHSRKIPFSRDFLEELSAQVSNQGDGRIEKKNGIVGTLNRFLADQSVCEYIPRINDFVLPKISINKRDLYVNPLALRNGLIGHAFNSMQL